LSLSEAKEQFPDFFDSSDWVDRICNATELPLIDLIDSAMVGDVFCSQFCQVTLIEKETLEAVAPCQECGEEVPESEACGEGNDWFCPDCYEPKPVKVALDFEDLGLPMNYFQRLAEENHKLITQITQQGPGRALAHLGKVSDPHAAALACFRRCAEFVAMHPQPFAVESYKGGRGLFGAVLKGGVPTWTVLKAVK
jgi:hypothetical protein